jgi:hypothetical protein
MVDFGMAPQDALEAPHLLHGGPDQDVAALLHEKVQRVAGVQVQVIADRLRNDELPFAGQGGGCHCGLFLT